MRYSEEKIDSIGKLIDLLKEHIKDLNCPLWYRGQSKSAWLLEPKLLRGGAGQPETYLINRFKQHATLLLSYPPKNNFEWLFIMQHYSMATRLLDWSESPLVALYFAVRSNIDSEGALWILLPTILNEKNNYRPDYPHEVPSFEDEHLINYLPETIARETHSRLLPLAAIAPRNNPRIQAQQGVFTISHRDNIPIEDAGAAGAARDHVWRYLIPPAAKPTLLHELLLLGISKFQLFPELDSISVT